VKRSIIEALWRSRPGLTQEQVRRATGAPKATVRHVYAQLVAAGVLERPPTAWTALELA
jgi:DNA-binding IclR family transcriptional regulator